MNVGTLCSFTQIFGQVVLLLNSFTFPLVLKYENKNISFTKLISTYITYMHIYMGGALGYEEAKLQLARI